MIDKNQTLLIIEDELSIRRFLKASLLSQKFKIVEAETGTEGLALAASQHPKLILLDLGLPDMDGLNVLKRPRGWTVKQYCNVTTS